MKFQYIANIKLIYLQKMTKIENHLRFYTEFTSSDLWALTAVSTSVAGGGCVAFQSTFSMQHGAAKPPCRGAVMPWQFGWEGCKLGFSLGSRRIPQFHSNVGEGDEVKLLPLDKNFN